MMVAAVCATSWDRTVISTAYECVSRAGRRRWAAWKPVGDEGQNEDMSLTVNDVVNLLAIRSLRDAAMAQSRTAGTVQRQIAVILLDAAIERTVFTACEYLQIQLPQNAKLDAALQKLTAHGWKPAQGLESDRKRLHQQRNNVQHLGGNVDRDEVPGWVITTAQYTANVVQFAFTVDLDDVHYAAAIADPDTAGELTSAEDALMCGDLVTAIAAIDRGFVRTKSVWDSFAVTANSELAPRYPHYERGIGRIGGDDPKIVALQDVTLISAIAPDAGEVLWYLSARRDSSLLTADEVRRALVFVFTLAAAVEATPAATRIDRRHRDAIANRHERTHPEQHARLGDYELKRLGDRTTASFTLLDVPPPSTYNDWSAAVAGLLNTAPSQVAQFKVWDDGTLSIHDVRDITADVAAITAALNSADDVVAAAVTDTARNSEAEAEFGAAYRARLARAIAGRGLPPWLHLKAVQGYAGENPWAVALTLDDPVGGYWDVDTVQAAFEAAGVRGITSYHGWLLHQQQPEEIPDVLSRLLPHLQVVVDAAAAASVEQEAVLAKTVALLTQQGFRRRNRDE